MKKGFRRVRHLWIAMSWFHVVNFMDQFVPLIGFIQNVQFFFSFLHCSLFSVIFQKSQSEASPKIVQHCIHTNIWTHPTDDSIKIMAKPQHIPKMYNKSLGCLAYFSDPRDTFCTGVNYKNTSAQSQLLLLHLNNNITRHTETKTSNNTTKKKN